MLVLSQALPFEGVGDFLSAHDVDVKVLKKALMEYETYCSEEIQGMDHYAEPEGWIEAVGYRETIEQFLSLL